ncbi:hypothetical protein Tco_1130551 [Tanacetum coccineum]
MVWSKYVVLTSGKTDSTKINNISGCLRGSTFVYSEVFKLDFSSASLHLKYLLSLNLLSCLDMELVFENVLMRYGAELTASLGSWAWLLLVLLGCGGAGTVSLVSDMPLVWYMGLRVWNVVLAAAGGGGGACTGAGTGHPCQLQEHPQRLQGHQP